MIFNKHSELEGHHAFLGASKYHWLNYTPERLEEIYISELAKKKGTELHDFASRAIKLGIKLKGRNTLALFVNDAIDLDMESEQVLFYSYNCFGTTDAISFRDERVKGEDGYIHKRKTLRIHDLKTGKNEASEKQLLIYAALFCLEYKQKPEDIYTELRIYQYDDCSIYIPITEEIKEIMDLIVSFDNHLDNLNKEEYQNNVLYY